MKTNYKILKVWVEHKIDDSPDTSHLGSFSDTRESHFSIDRQEQNEWRRGEYRYFNPSFNYVDKQGEPLPDLTADDVAKYVTEDYRRMSALGVDWHYIGVIAKAEIVSPQGVCQVIRSGGLWGVESDSGDYIKSVERDELDNLAAELASLGIGKRAIAYAMKHVGTQKDSL